MANKCEYAYRDTRYKFLVCLKLSEGKIPPNGQEASKYICNFQRFCALSQCYENTDSAKGCLIKKQREE